MAIQDRNVVRTAADLEKKYNFAQLFGLKGNVESTAQALTKVENELNNMLNALVINLSDVLDTQSSISLWFYEGIPTTSNEPYIDWLTPNDHIGDLYYDQNSGYVYKYTNIGWVLQDDTNLINAMALTNVELDVTSDHERQVFFQQPTPPYANGDWWVLDDGTLMICQLSKPLGEIYEKDDFIVSSRYVETISVKQNDTIEVLKGQVVTITDTMVSYTDKATGKTTAISGDSITTGSIKSQNYVANTSGTKISLTDGTIDTKNFKVSNNGSVTATNANITGAITATSGTFTGTINASGGYFRNGEINLIGDEYNPTFTIKTSDNTKNLIVSPEKIKATSNSFETEIDTWTYDYNPYCLFSQMDKNVSTNRNTLKLYSNNYNEFEMNNAYGHIDCRVSDDVQDAIINVSSWITGHTTSVTCEGIWTPSLTQTSLAESKENFEKINNALNIIKNIDIYKYNLKGDKKSSKKHIGFVIGDKYNYSEEVTSNNNDGVDIYSFVSVCCKAIQEQQEQIEELKKEVETLKKHN